MLKNIVTFLFLLTLCVAGDAFATNKVAEQPCDTKIWEQMSHRGWLEAEREIMQNQNLIFKPDSVLDYACFDQFANIAAAQGGEIFVHTNYFGPKIIQRGSPQATDTGIRNLVYVPLSTYKANFAHSFLGGRSDAMRAASTKHQPKPPSGTSASYNCSHMSAVWHAAKCANFIDNDRFELTDGFYPFETVKGFDGQDVVGYKSQEDGGPGIDEPRQYPFPCGSGTGLISWKTGIEKAENRGENLYNFQTPLGEIFKEVNDKIEPGNCTSGKGIETGLTVITKDGPAGKDGVCTNPGCTFTEGGSCSADGNAGGG